MNEDIFRGKWNEIQGKIRQKWGKLTDDDLTVIKGRHDEIFGLLQKHYGYTREQVKREVDRLL